MGKIKKLGIYLFSILFISLFCFGLFLYIKKSPIVPIAFEPPETPEFTGIWEKNELLLQAELIADGKVIGPETLALDKEGNIFTGTVQGWILKIFPDGKIQNFANTGGRPLGMKFNSTGDLIVCDTKKGLLSINPSGKIEVLAINSPDGIPFMLAEDLDISTDGTIYFTDASDSFGVENYILDLLEGRPHGRLLSYDPFTKTVTTLLDKLYFANGVVLSTNEDFVLVNETYRYRIRRYWLKGNKAGSNDIFIDNLPGFPDNITSNKNGVYHLALFTIRNPILDFIHPYPFLSSTVAKLPGFLWTKPEPYGFVISLDESGKILNTYQDTKGALLKGITSVIEFDGYLYLGSLHEDKIGKLKL